MEMENSFYSHRLSDKHATEKICTSHTVQIKKYVVNARKRIRQKLH